MLLQICTIEHKDNDKLSETDWLIYLHKKPFTKRSVIQGSIRDGDEAHKELELVQSQCLCV